METIQKKILLEDYIDRNYDSPTYGSLTATSFYVNVNITQNIDDMAMFTDVIYIPKDIGFAGNVDYTILIDKLSASGITFPFMTGVVPLGIPQNINPITRVIGKNASDYYYTTNSLVTGTTESRADDVRSYNNLTKYDLNFNTNTETYVNYVGNPVNGVDRVTSLNPTAFTYVFGADITDPNIGTINQNDGLFFVQNSGATSSVFSYHSQGWNETNLSLSAITKEEYLFGIISKPEVESDVFIDRGIVTIYDKHLKMSEITNLGELTRYNRGYYNIIKS